MHRTWFRWIYVWIFGWIISLSGIEFIVHSYDGHWGSSSAEDNVALGDTSFRKPAIGARIFRHRPQCSSKRVCLLIRSTLELIHWQRAIIYQSTSSYWYVQVFAVPFGSAYICVTCVQYSSKSCFPWSSVWKLCIALGVWWYDWKTRAHCGSAYSLGTLERCSGFTKVEYVVLGHVGCHKRLVQSVSRQPILGIVLLVHSRW